MSVSLQLDSPTLASTHTSNSIVESELGQVASLVGGVEDLVVEDGEVQGETETDGVGGSKVGLGNLSGGLVGLKGSIGGTLATVADGELGKVTVVVTLPIRRGETRQSWIAIASRVGTAWVATHILW